MLETTKLYNISKEVVSDDNPRKHEPKNAKHLLNFVES